MKKLALSIILGLGLSSLSSVYAQTSWSFLQNKNLSAGIGIQSTDLSLSINYLKKQDRNQLLLISKKDMNCLVCTMQFNFGPRALNADIEFLNKNSNNEYVYAVLNKVAIVRGFSYSGSFALSNPKTGSGYNFNGNVPVNFFDNNDTSEWLLKNDAYQTDSLNYYNGRESIVYATIGINKRIKSIKTLTMNGVNLNCNPNCDMVTYFSGGQATYKITREDNLGRISYRLPENFIKDMQTYNKAKDNFAIKVKTLERGDMLFKFDSSTYSDNAY